MPGRLDNFLGRRSNLRRCPKCQGVDLLSLGFIHHQPDCPDSPCQFCGNTVNPSERRTTHAGRTAHLDCSIDYLNHLDEEHSRG